MALETHMKLSVTEPDFFEEEEEEENKLAQEGKKWILFIYKSCRKFFKNLFYNEILYICYVPAQIPHLGKISFQEYKPNAISQSESKIFEWTIQNNLIK